MAEIADTAGAALGLPPAGLLTFFYDAENQPAGFDPKDADGATLIFVPPDQPVSRRPFPSSTHATDPIHLAAHAALSLPGLTDERARSWSLDTHQSRDYDQYQSHYAWLVDRTIPPRSYDVDRVCGHADWIQNDARMEAQLASNGVYVGEPEDYKTPRARRLSAGASEWRLLWQITSRDGWFHWGAMGMLYILIRDSDLRARAFHKSWVVLQCT
jgi:uncharacterized protein YwqG